MGSLLFWACCAVIASFAGAAFVATAVGRSSAGVARPASPERYLCAACAQVFEKPKPEVWSELDAKKEAAAGFPREVAGGERFEVVCDDCYQRITVRAGPWTT